MTHTYALGMTDTFFWEWGLGRWLPAIATLYGSDETKHLQLANILAARIITNPFLPLQLQSQFVAFAMEYHVKSKTHQLPTDETKQAIAIPTFDLDVGWTRIGVNTQPAMRV